ncbi:TetR/AcrR family transcriptional regulator [Teredinibacter turnerae]|uniref:TetR/AcrR family transcriptional regulator n=1 Tax=Teredinibacter turnerae TaxID=2426 RepID=UPI000375A613|nr:TetR/AcrR family transcriptional regulator [Teredinibacter turnerae]
MTTTKKIRTGGRSARIQQSIHQAVRELQATHSREELTVCMIASAAGVTPSTIYRRWGDLTSLLADVAVAHMRPDTPPDDTGSLPGDLLKFAEFYADELGSELGKQLLRDIAATHASDCTTRCVQLARERLEIIVERAQQRGERIPAVEMLIDNLFAPIVYNILFCETPDREHQLRLVSQCLHNY